MDKIALLHQIILIVLLNAINAIILSTNNDSSKIRIPLIFKYEFRGSFDYEIYDACIKNGKKIKGGQWEEKHMKHLFL